MSNLTKICQVLHELQKLTKMFAFFVKAKSNIFQERVPLREYLLLTAQTECSVWRADDLSRVEFRQGLVRFASDGAKLHLAET